MPVMATTCTNETRLRGTIERELILKTEGQTAHNHWYPVVDAC